MSLRKTAALCLTAFMLLTMLPSFAEQTVPAIVLTPAPKEYFSPLDAVISSTLNGASNLTNTADDYTVPQGTYFNGVKVKVVAIENTFGNYPEQLSDPQQLWARVIIAQNEHFDGIEGLMPLLNLSFDLSDVTGELPAGELTGDTELYASNGLDDTVIASFPTGTKFIVLGWLKDWLHIEIEGQAGFLQHDKASLSQAVLNKIASALPGDFDEIQPGYQERHETYMVKLMELYDKYGDSNLWPLDVAAQASQLASEAGYQFSDVIHVMPGENELSEEEVLAIALQAAIDLYQLDDHSWSSSSLAFFHHPGEPEDLFWKASLWGNHGIPNVKIWMDAKGEVINSMIDSEPAFIDGPIDLEEAMREAQGTLEYYLWGIQTNPNKDELNEQTAINRAWELFKESVDEKERTSYAFESAFYTNDDGSLRWWLVTVVEQFSANVSVYYHIALIMPDGQVAYQTNPDIYLEDQQWAKDMAEFDLKEKEFGPFHTWPLEEKASWDPEFFGLPEEKELSMEEARQVAVNELKTTFNLSDETVELFDVSYYFVIYQQRAWQIVFTKKNEGADSDTPGYIVKLDAMTGELLDLFVNEYEQ